MSVTDDQRSESVVPAVVARGISVTGRWGRLFGPVNIDLAAGGVTVLVGPTGLASTALLLTLSGRMRPTAGTVTVLGHIDSAQISRVATVAALGDLDALDDFTTVGELVTEQMRWNAVWYRGVQAAAERQVDAVCRPVFGPLPSPPRSSFVGELDELVRVLLRIALANTRRRALLMVGSIDQVAGHRCRDILLSRLADLGRNQTVITTAADEVANKAVRAQIRVDDAAGADMRARRAGAE